MTTQDQSIKFVQINLQHAKASTMLLGAELARLHTHIALIQEPWIQKQKVAGLSTIKGAKCVYDESSTRPRTAIVLSKHINSQPLPQFTVQDMASVLIKTTNPINADQHISIVIASLYLPIEEQAPPGPALFNLIAYCKNHNLPYVIGCDSNAHHTVWGSRDTNRRGEKLLEFMLSNDVEIANKGCVPTFFTQRGQSVIDITLTSPHILPRITNWKVSENETLSDHKQIEFDLLCVIPPQPTFQNPKKLKEDVFRQHLGDLLLPVRSQLQEDTLSPIVPSIIIENTTNALTSAMKQAFDKACPPINPKKKTGKFWWNRSLENFKRLTRRALQRARRAQPENKEILWSEYRLIRKEYKKLITNTKTQSWQEFCTNTETLSATARLNKLLCKSDQNNIEWIKKSDGNAATQPQDILSVLLDTHFPGNFQHDEDTFPLQTSNSKIGPYNSCLETIFSEQKILWAITQFQPYKAPGPDNIYPICLQIAADLVVPIIKPIFELCLQTTYLPKIWRTSKVIFIPKPAKLSYNEAKSFRPISLTCFLLKTLERLIETYIKGFVFTTNPLNQSQHAYTCDKSTDSALHTLTNKLESSLQKSHSTLCTFLDIQGAFDHTTPAVVKLALKSHGLQQSIIELIDHLLLNRSIIATHQNYSIKRSVNRGCPQGGILSPLLWNTVANQLLNVLSSHKIWCLGYADDIVIAVEGTHINTCVEVSQYALSLIEKWCQANSLSVNASKTEALLVTKKRKFDSPKLCIFNENIQFKTSVKYLGIHIDQRLSWSTHISKKLEKSTKVLWMCRRAVGARWGLGPQQMLWVLRSIVQPLFLHGVVVWWKSTLKTNHLAQITKINRTALLMTTGAFKTSPTLGLEFLLNVTPLEITAQRCAMNTWYRLMRSGFKPGPKNGHSDISQTLSDITPLYNQPPDFVNQKLSFIDESIKFLFPTKENWLDNDFSIDQFDICAYTDGSLNDMGVGAGVFIHQSNVDPDYSDPVLNHPISLSKSSTIFQAEMMAVNAASIALFSTVDCNIAIISDSQAVLKALNNPRIKTVTKSNCIQALNHLALNNRVSLVWVPSHSGIAGNERADELANIGAALETYGPDPAPPIALSVIKAATKEWASDMFFIKWRNTNNCQSTKEVLKTLDFKYSQHLAKLRKPLLSHTINTITGHGPFRKHLLRLKLTDEPSCPFCGANEDTNIHYIFHCPHFMNVRNFPKKRFPSTTMQNQQNRIAISCLVDFISRSNRFGDPMMQN